MAPTYGQAIRIGWTILWRGVGSVMLFLTSVNALIIFGMPELGRTSPSLGVFFFSAHADGAARHVCHHAMAGEVFVHHVIFRVSSPTRARVALHST